MTGSYVSCKRTLLLGQASPANLSFSGFSKCFNLTLGR
uniref:Uncharacterized protein n=1 Tax=Anguilla anguilla TaxID=7936 RepID=A0A0E9QJ91_ANGAN